MWATIAVAGVIAAFPALAVQDSDEACGCGWRRHKACSISAKQQLESLTHSRILKTCDKIEDDAKNPNTDSYKMAKFECDIRKQIQKKAERLKPCLAHTTREECDAAFATGCQWEAQGAMECGINEYHLISDIIDHRDGTFISEEARGHPLFQLIEGHDYCASHDHQSCPVSECQWRGFECDVSPSSFFWQVLHRPALLNLAHIAGPAVHCRSRYEHGDGVCEEGCVEDNEICRLNAGAMKYRPYRNSANKSEETLKGMIDVICRNFGFYQYEDSSDPAQKNIVRECYHPCQSSTGADGKKQCKAPASLDDIYGLDRNVSLTQLDFEVLEIFTAVRSATVVYEMHCEQFSDRYESCKAASEVCDEGFIPDYGHSTMAPGAIGLKGFLGDVAKALDEGSLVDFFEDHLHTELDDADKDALKKRGKELFEEWLKKPQDGWGKHGGGRSPFDVLDRKDDEKKEEKESFPWLVAGGALLLAAVCGGLGLGVACTSPRRRYDDSLEAE